MIAAVRAGNRKRAAAGWVYVAQRPDGLVKVGYSRWPGDRIRRLECAHGELYVWALIPGTKETEAELHSRWSHLHIGHEWFRADEDLLTWAEGLPEHGS